MFSLAKSLHLLALSRWMNEKAEEELVQFERKSYMRVQAIKLVCKQSNNESNNKNYPEMGNNSLTFWTFSCLSDDNV